MTCFLHVRIKHFDLRDFSTSFFIIEFKWFFITTATPATVQHKSKWSELYPLYCTPHPTAAAAGNLFHYCRLMQMFILCPRAHPIIIGPGA